MKNVLISTPVESLSNDLKSALTSCGFGCDQTLNGKEAQLKIYNNPFFAIVLDIDTTNHSCFDVLKYIKLNHHSVMVLVYFNSREKFKSLEMDEMNLTKMGVNKIFIGPTAVQEIPKFFANLDSSKWKNIKSFENDGSNEGAIESAVQISDSLMTRTKVSNFLDNSMAVFDHYIRLGTNRYVKILNQGESFLPERIKKYSSDGLEYIYFSTKDRAVYINYMNCVVEKMLKSATPEKAVKHVSNITTKLIDEIYTQGIQPQLVEEGLNLCKNMQQLVKKESALNKLFDEYNELDPTSHSHLFLVSFFSTIICQNLSWAGTRTKDTIGLGALLHDIGMLKLPASCRDKNPSEMNEKEFSLFCQHPVYGYEMLQKFSCVTEPVKQIVYQHHETVSSSGFPNQLTSSKMYPLAKIISLADAFAEDLISQKVPPLEGIKNFLGDREKLALYDASVIRALVTGFLPKGT